MGHYRHHRNIIPQTDTGVGESWACTEYPHSYNAPAQGKNVSFIDPDTGQLTIGIQRVRYSHTAMIDLLIGQPGITQNEVASYFGYSVGWVSTIINSDAFQAALHERRAELTDPHLIKTINERLNAVAQLSLDKLLAKVSMPANAIDNEFLVATAKLATSALGYGARTQAGAGPSVTVQVVNVPGPMASAAEWAAKHARTGGAVIEEQRPVQARIGVDHEQPIPLAPRR